jgi:transcriptional regulator with XRE-family HTH domain
MGIGCRPTSANEHAVNQHVGLRIRDARIAIGWSLKRLGEEIGVDDTTVFKYENGKTRISVVRLLQIAACLGHPIGHFTDGAPALPVEQD